MEEEGIYRGGCSAFGMDRFCVALRPSVPLSLSLCAEVWIPTGRCAHTMQHRHTYARAHPPIRTKAEEPPLPRVPTCFRPQAAVITAQSRVVDQEDDASERASERQQRCSELPLLPLPSSSSCAKRDDLLQRAFQHALFSRK